MLSFLKARHGSAPTYLPLPEVHPLVWLHDTYQPEPLQYSGILFYLKTSNYLKFKKSNGRRCSCLTIWISGWILKKYLDVQFKLELMTEYSKLDISIRVSDESYQGLFFCFFFFSTLENLSCRGLKYPTKNRKSPYTSQPFKCWKLQNRT